HHRVGAGAHGRQVSLSAGIDERLLDLRSVRERVHHDVERTLSEIGPEPRGDLVDGVRVQIHVALVVPDLLGDLLPGIEYRVERVDALDLDLTPVRQGDVELSTLEALGEDAQCRRPRPDADGRAGAGECPDDRPTVSA